jgi:hypothetical protein
MARLPGRKIPGTSVRQLSCGCYVKFWPYTGVETLSRCKIHQAEFDLWWKRTPMWQKVLAYSVGIIVVGIPVVLTVLFILYILGFGIYSLFR